MEATEIFDALTHLKNNIYSGRKAIWDKHQALIDCKIDDVVPKGSGLPSHVPPDALREIRKAENQVYTRFQSLTFTPCGTKAEQDYTSNLGKLFDWLMQQNDIVNESNIGREVAADLVRGFSCLKGPFPNFEDAECPISWYPTDPMTVFPDPAGRFVIEEYSRYVADVYEELRKLNEAHGKDIYDVSWYGSKKYGSDYDEVQWAAWYSRDKRAFSINHQGGSIPWLINEQDNVFGYIPFSYSYSGWGKGRHRGKPAERCVGRLVGMESSITARARMLTASLNYMRYHVWPMHVYDLEFANHFTSGSLPTHPGDWKGLPRDAIDSMKVIEQGQVSQDLPYYMNIVEKDIEGLGGNEALQGSGSADESGRSRLYRIRQASLDFDPPREAFERMFTKLLTNAASLLENPLIFKEPVSWGGNEKISLSDVVKNVKVKFKQEFRDPQADQDLKEIGMREVERGLLLKEEYRRDYAKDAEWNTFIERKLAEDVMMTNPAISGSLAQKGLILSGVDIPGVEGGAMPDQRKSPNSPVKQTIRAGEMPTQQQRPQGMANMPGMGEVNGP